MNSQQSQDITESLNNLGWERTTEDIWSNQLLSAYALNV